MRLSEAIRLGSLAIDTPASLDTRFCAIGMACEAIGKRHLTGNWLSGVDYRNYVELEKAWPWVEADYHGEEIYGLDEGLDNYETAIFTIFDDGVATGEMTLEALCDQVRAWEDELAAKGINVEQVMLAAELTEPACQAAEHSEKELAWEAK